MGLESGYVFPRNPHHTGAVEHSPSGIPSFSRRASSVPSVTIANKSYQVPSAVPLGKSKWCGHPHPQWFSAELKFSNQDLPGMVNVEFREERMISFLPEVTAINENVFTSSCGKAFRNKSEGVLTICRKSIRNEKHFVLLFHWEPFAIFVKPWRQEDANRGHVGFSFTLRFLIQI